MLVVGQDGTWPTAPASWRSPWRGGFGALRSVKEHVVAGVDRGVEWKTSDTVAISTDS